MRFIKKYNLTLGIGLCVLLGLASCSLNSNNYKNKLSWLKGTWASSHQAIAAEETWTWDDDEKCYSASGFMTQYTDTLYTQTLKIHSEKEDIFLSVKSSSKIETKEAFFKLTNSNQDSLVFQNVFDQYPMYIIYVNASPQLKTQAVGQKQGQTIIDSRVYDRIDLDQE